MAIEYDFDERLSMSNGQAVCISVKSILLDIIPGALKIHQAHTLNDRAGVDWWAEQRGGRFIGVDTKIRNKDYAINDGPDDLALETWSVIEKQVIGWTRDERKLCDYVLWLWQDTGRYCLVPFHLLCLVFQKNWEKWKAEFKTDIQTTSSIDKQYHSECVYVPRRQVWAAIYTQCHSPGVKLQEAKV